MGMVFQSYALFPHMSVFENVAYGLKVRRVPGPEIARRVAEALRVVRLGDFGDRSVRQLSGGQQQRVALARAVVIEPAILLMDEPLGALNRQLRKEVQLEIRRMHVGHPRTTLYVTHDQEEALVMSDRVAVMRSGRIVQIGSGQDLYERPIDAFVARFLGESNLLPGTVRAVSGDRAGLEVAGFPHPVEGRAGPRLAPGQAAVALLRPETIRPQPVGTGGVPARVLERVYLGELVAARLALNPERDGMSPEVWCRRLAGDLPDDDCIEIGWDRDRASILAEALN